MMAARQTGLLDPIIGVRYSGAAFSERWKLTLESAVKLPIGDRHALFSTGRTDFGLQMNLQRRWRSQAFYLDLAAVYYSGASEIIPEPAQVLPTLILGYE